MPDILFFDEITDADATRVGGKGLSLGKTATAGLPVPPGFVVTTQAYRRLAERGIRSDSELHARHSPTRTRRSAAGRSRCGPSATAEDAADTSFAGQQETILGVEGDDALLDAIERCWRSLFTERAVAYRAKQGVDAAELAMAVVVQQLVPAEMRPACCSPATRSTPTASDARGGVVGAGRGGRLGPRAAGPLHARPRDREPSSSSTSARSRFASRRRRGARPAAEPAAVLPRVTPRCHSSPNSAGRSKTSTATPATSSGPTPAASSSCCRPGRSRWPARRSASRCGRQVIAELKAKADPRGTVVGAVQPERGAARTDADDVGGGAAVARGRRRVRRDEPRPRR